MKIRILLLLTVALGYATMQSQTNDISQLPNLIPPSPEASSLFKFVETPVNLSDGLASIDIPIYTIKTKGIQIPISLSYHSRGILVAEIASRVGLGWTLNYGGMISRQVRGKSDDGSGFGYLSQNFYENFFTDQNTRDNLYQSHLNNTIDFDPDLFFFNFPGHSGKFIFDQATSEPWQQKYSDININTPSKNGAIIEDWTIIDEKGNTFYFGNGRWDFENTSSHKFTQGGTAANIPSVEDPTYNTWHLYKIVTYEQEEITFDYQMPENISYIRRSYDTFESSSSTLTSYYSDVDGYQRQIKQINFPGGKIVFSAATSYREDLTGGRALDYVTVYDDNNQVIARYDLDYSYVTSPTTNNRLSHLVGLDPKSNKRMFLASVTKSANGESLPPYQFDYSAVKLPNRFSNSQDNWGYFNAADNGSYLTFFDYGSSTNDRRVDSTKNGAGLLRKITYPTGGSASYEYEQNIAVKPSFLNSLVSPGNNPLERQYMGLGHLEVAYFDGVKFSKPVVIGDNLAGSVKSSIDFDYGSCSDGQSTSYCNFSVVLKRSSGESYVLPFGSNKSNAGIPPGSYTLEVYPPGRNSSLYFVANLYWDEEVPQEDSTGNELILASGKRIKKIIYSDGQVTLKTKEYGYNEPSGQNSGKIFGLPNFYSIQEVMGDYILLDKYGCRPGSPLTSLQGNNLAYGYVTEYEGTKDDNIGKTEYEFTNFSDDGEYYKFPYHLPIDNQWLRGKLKAQKMFKNLGSSYSLVKKVENQYLYAGINSPAIVAYQPILYPGETVVKTYDDTSFEMPLAVFTPDDQQQDGHAYKVYYQKGGTSDLHSTTQTDYLESENGSQTVTSTKTNFYNYSDHYQVAGSEETTDGKTSTTTYWYTPEVTLYGSLGYDALSSIELSSFQNVALKNRIVPVQTEVETKEGNTTVAKTVQRTLFGSGNFPLPASLEGAKLGENLETRITFYKYDASGNPLELSKDNGPHIIYLWGYEDQYPIAKIENATYSDVSAALGFSDLGIVDESDLSVINNLRSSLSLPHALITTYTYKPLIGMTTVTDPAGRVTNYEYDGLGRLESVKDSQGNLVSKTEYHYNY
jgi:YD repeat-containing protein